VEPQVAHQAHLFGQVVVVGQDCAALEGVEELGGAKAQHLAALALVFPVIVFPATLPSPLLVIRAHTHN
jgi:hypothetical protein